MKILYGIENNKIDVTEICFQKFLNNNIIKIPFNDLDRVIIFTDPAYGIKKKIFVDVYDNGQYQDIHDDKIAEIDIVNKTITTYSVLSIDHNAGFFACCTVRLYELIKYWNEHKSLPSILDTSVQFSWYKIDPIIDITFDYFAHYDNIQIKHELKTTSFDFFAQFHDYRKLQFEELTLFMVKYYSPSEIIKKIISEIEISYPMDYSNICVLFYRGNDKNIETKICGYDEYIEKAKLILKENPTITFLIQSDETEFIETMVSEFPENSFYFKEYIRHMKKCYDTVDKVMKDQNYLYSKYFLAITIIMSRCNYIVCGSGNCSLFIILYRGHTKNLYQNLDNHWIS